MTNIEFEILEDGQIVVKTSDVAEKDHASADEILGLIEEAMGSKRQTKPLEHPLLKNKRVLRGGKIVAA